MKNIPIKVIPSARKNNVTEKEGKLKVHVLSPTVDGKANKAVIEVLAKYFKVKKNAVQIIKGEKPREKLVQVNI